MKKTFFQTRTSICPECHRIIGANHIQDKEGLHLEKFCPTHGHFKTRIASDYNWLNSLQQYTADTVVPSTRQTKISKGCPLDCGECPDHNQMSAFFLFEITNGCNLSCPVCLGEPKSKGKFVSLSEVKVMIKQLLKYAGPGQIVTLGGGEPTIHPLFFDIVKLLKQNGLTSIWVYTNGRRIARDNNFAKKLADEGLYVVLQWDGFDNSIYRQLRNKDLLEEKKQALKNLKKYGARAGICPTIVKGINDKHLGQLYKMFVKDKSLGTLDIATMAYIGKGKNFVKGKKNRITSQDVLFMIEKQTKGDILTTDFSPVSFSHPECLQISYLIAMPDGSFMPLKRFISPEDFKSIIMNKPLITLDINTINVFRDLVNKLWASGKNDKDTKRGLLALRYVIKTLFPTKGALSSEEFNARSMELVKIILIHSYMDDLNFDIGRSKMCISRTMLSDGRLMPTCAYNVIHRGAV